MKYVKVSGEKIRQARKSKGLTQGDLGASIGVSASMIGQYETEVRRPSFKTAAAVARVLGIDEKALMVDLEADNFQDIQELNTVAMTDIEQNNTIPGRLVAARETAGLTQEQLASKIGVQRAVISKYETGAIEPSVSQLRKLADALDTTIAELLNADDTDEAAPAGVGDKIRFYRKAQKLTQEELADRADVSIFTLRQYERGARLSPRTDQLIKLAQALNVSVDDLLCADGKGCEMDTGLGKRICLARVQKKLTQSELGEMVGVSGTAIMRYEKGEREPKILLIRKIAEALGVPANSLLGVSAQDLRGCAEMPEVSDVARLFVSVSEIGCLLQNGEITVSTSRQTIRITLSAE